MYEPVSIGIFDDNPIILSGLKTFLSDRPEYEVAFTCQNPQKLASEVAKHQPEVMIMDVIVEGVFGLEKFQEVHEKFPEVIIVSFSNVSSLMILENLFAVGARAFVSKRDDLETLHRILQTVLTTGKPYVPSELQSLMGKAEIPLLLTRREQVVLGHIIDGRVTKQIAVLENISVHTADFHRRNLLKKFGATNVAELVREGIEFGYKRG